MYKDFNFRCGRVPGSIAEARRDINKINLQYKFSWVLWGKPVCFEIRTSKSTILRTVLSILKQGKLKEHRLSERQKSELPLLVI